METYLKTVCIVIVGIFLCIILSRKANDYSLVLVIILCCAICTVAFAFLKPILDFVKEIGELIGANGKWLPLLLKSAGLSLIGEITVAICTESGHASLAKVLQMLTTISIMWVSLPLIQSLLDLIQSILEML